MRLEILGSGGALSTPRALCACALCQQARQRGVPYSRSGPSVFVHGPDLIIDTPEDVVSSLARSSVECIAAGTYSHWHPDHVLGLRLWESLNGDYLGWPAHNGKTPIYLPDRVACDIREKLGVWESFEFMQRRGLVEIIELGEGEGFQIGAYCVTPLALAEEYVFAQLIEGQGRRVFVAADELFGWWPPDDLGHLDVAVLPLGVVEFDLLSGARHYPADHPVLAREATVEQTLAVVRQLDVDRVVLTHISEADQVGYDEALQLQQQWQAEDLPVSMAYDGLLIEV